MSQLNMDGCASASTQQLVVAAAEHLLFMCDDFNTLNITKCSIILNLYYILMTRVTFFKAHIWL